MATSQFDPAIFPDRYRTETNMIAAIASDVMGPYVKVKVDNATDGTKAATNSEPRGKMQHGALLLKSAGTTPRAPAAPRPGRL